MGDPIDIEGAAGKQLGKNKSERVAAYKALFEGRLTDHTVQAI
jgi:hypothetical protein